MFNLKNLLKYCIFYSQSFALIRDYVVLTATFPEERGKSLCLKLMSIALPKSNKTFSLHI